MVMRLNNLTSDLKCTAADVPLLLHLLSKVNHLDFLHADIQGAEGDLLGEPRVTQAMDQRVYRLIVGTHSQEIHRRLTDVFSHWITIFSLPYGFGPCITRLRDPSYRSKGKTPGREFWARLRDEECYHRTPQGMVTNWDGMLVLDNPRFTQAAATLSMTDFGSGINAEKGWIVRRWFFFCRPSK